MERKILLTIAYKGTRYCGFQCQPNGVSIEGTLNAALTQIAGHPVALLGAGRTDAGVHALGQRATFVLRGSIPTNRIVAAVNGLLPDDIVVVKAEEVAEDFHCRYDVVGKHYRYRVRNAALPSPFTYDTSYFFPGDLDLTAMAQAAAPCGGEHDFRAFTATNSGREDFRRRLDGIALRRVEDELWLDFWGPGFLYKMVRSLSGALIDVGRGYFSGDVVAAALETGDRSLLSLTAPACGLTLVKIYYDEKYFLDKDASLRYTNTVSP